MIARAILALFAIAMIATGVAFCAVAINVLLIPLVGEPGAAALTALVLFFIVGAGKVIYLAFSRSKPVMLPPSPTATAQHAQQPQSQDALVVALTQMAQHYPLLAIACSATLGLAEALNKKTH